MAKILKKVQENTKIFTIRKIKIKYSEIQRSWRMNPDEYGIQH